MTNYYEILGVPVTASAEDINQRYRFWVQAFHPDRFNSSVHRLSAGEDFKKINAAYQTLKDPAKRQAYDKKLHVNQTGFGHAPHASGSSKSNAPAKDVLVDIDGNVYKTVKIGSQLWMTENLQVTRYRNGDKIPEVTNDSKWSKFETGASCVYDNNARCAVTFGYFYNWSAVVDVRNIAPAGWRVPTDDDWKELEIHLGMSRPEADEEGNRGSPVGSRLAGNADLWLSDDLTNQSEFGSSGFSALPAGCRFGAVDGFFGLVGFTYFWSATAHGANTAWLRHLGYYSSAVYRASRDKQGGLSVRLVRG